MQDLTSTPASAALRPFVRAYAQRDIDLGSSSFLQPVPASLEQILEFDFFDPLQVRFPDGHWTAAHHLCLVGAHTHPGYMLRFGGRIQTFAIFFEPFGLWQLFRLPNKELVDRQVCARAALGRAAEDLWEQLAACRTFMGRVATVERFLLPRIRTAAARLPVMNAAVMLFQNRGADRVQQLATDSACSLRHFERTFVEATGVAPKLFARVTRFQSAVDAKLRFPHTSWLTIAHSLGYHDQMHMVRDFHDLGGAAPGHTLAALGDTRPPALVTS